MSDFYNGTSQDINILKRQLGSEEIYTCNDTVQNFRIDYVENSEVEDMKNKLKSIGAKKFRLVRRGYYTTAICFYIDKDAIDKLGE